ncbi:hypothetical protein F8M41_012677 [Gigaspora margarita]|uniref:Uncharacterized protein n=1 Tax=Gigaspora margarita TaxID=4874 RepID=A0A8H3X0T9_GIGMA|nr:hypothetical protein F8M41_012677 [Gigaspora margarita]
MTIQIERTALNSTSKKEPKIFISGQKPAKETYYIQKKIRVEKNKNKGNYKKRKKEKIVPERVLKLALAPDRVRKEANKIDLAQTKTPIVYSVQIQIRKVSCNEKKELRKLDKIQSHIKNMEEGIGSQLPW